METNFNKISATDGRLKVTLTPEDYQADVDKQIKEYAKTAKIKGFRPGHVPFGYIKKLYGKSLLVDTVINKVSGAVNSYITENKLKVVGDPMPDNDAYKIDWDNDTEFNFEYEVGTASDFTVDLEKLPAIENYEIEPTKSQVDDAIEDLQKRFGTDLEPEDAEIGDLLFGTLRQESSEFESQSGIPTDKVVKKSQKLFKGLEKGSKVTFDIQSIFETDKDLGFAIGKSDEEAAALAGDFEFTVDKISRVAPAKIDQELFDKAIGEGKVSDEEGFREEISNIIKENYNRESGFLLDFDVEKTLVDNIKIDLPDAYLKKWLLAVNEGKVTEEDIEKEYDAFARGVRLDLIKGEIASNNGEEIKVEYDDVLEVVKAEIKNYFGPQAQGMDDFITQMAKKQLEENKDNAFRNYYNKAFGKKVIDFAKGKISIKNKSVKVEEFNEIAKAKYETA
ncbi:trigger factor [Jiulongibacter sediminis]|uniref:Trigger factor n=1 Tax=Jiulongibacter sediminis TaxID=1605367 RepID=A0A0P7BYM5_9BACT|nr:trigger factor [Jiulongibacter sediminis]KPM47208.1 trigger factor [Jiulongibacter sediminis]TBX22766.1 trigger factor [Jiulongibacter sediminis]